MQQSINDLANQRGLGALLRAYQDGLGKLEFALAIACVFLAPMNFIRYSGFYLTLSDVCASACILVMLANGSFPSRPLGRGTPLWIMGLLLLTGGLVTSSIVNGDTSRGLIVSAQYAYAYLVLPWIISNRPMAQLVILVKAFVLAIALLCIHGIYLINIDGAKNTPFVTGSGRLMSLVERTNEFASLIALTVPLLLWLAEQGHIKRLFTWAAVSLFVYGVTLTGSNTGLLALLFAIGMYFLPIITWRRIIVAASGMVVITLVVRAWGTEFLPVVFQKRVLTAIESGSLEEAGTFTHRMELMKESLSIAKHTFSLGVGADEYRRISVWDSPVHNAYLLIWTEGGLFALFGFVLMLVAALFTIAGVLRRPYSWSTFACGLSSVILFSFLINAVPHVYGRFWIVPMVLAISLCMGYVRDGRAPVAGTVASQRHD